MNSVEIPVKLTGVSQMKQELRELKDQMLNTTDPAVFAALADKAGALQQKLAGVNKEISQFSSGSNFDQALGAFDQLGMSIMNLNFAAAARDSANLNQTIGALGAADVTKQFTGLTTTIGNLGKTFLSLGKLIITHPIFIIAAAIAVIVAIVAAVLNKFGLLKKVLDVLMAPVKAIIQAFKDLGDAIGLSDYEGEKNLEEQRKRSEKNLALIDREAKAKEDMFNLVQGLSVDEIKILREKYGVEVDLSQSTFDIKAEQLEAKNKENLDLQQKLLEKKSMTKEEKDELAKLKNEYAENARQIVSLEQQKITARIKLNTSLDKQIEMLNAKQIKNEGERAKVMLDIQLKEALAKVDLQIQEAKRLGDTEALSKAMTLKTLIMKDFERQKNEIGAKSTKATTSDVKKGHADVESAQDKHLKQMRIKHQIAMDEAKKAGMSEIDLSKLRITQLQEEADELKKINLKNTKIFKDELEKKKAISGIELQIDEAQKKLNEDILKADFEKRMSVLETNQLTVDSEREKLVIQKDIITEKRDFDLKNEKLTQEEKDKINAEAVNSLKETNKKIEEINQQTNLKILQNAQLAAETKFSREQFDLERSAKTDEQKLAAAKTLLQSELDLQAAQKLTELSNKELSEQEIAAIEEKYRQQKIAAEENATKKIEQIKKDSNARIFKAIDTGLETSVQGLNAISSLLSISQNNKLKGVKKGSAEEEKILKQQFKQQKAMQLAMAAINGAQAITAILSVPDFTFGIASGIRIAAAVAATAASISSIASTSFEGGGNVPDVNLDTANTGASVSSATPATPNVNLFGSANQFNNLGSTGQANGQTVTVQAVVSETDITNVQNKISNIQKNAEL